MTSDPTGGQAYRTCHDWRHGEELSTTVASAISEAAHGKPFAVRPLNEIIDAEALDRLFRPSGGSLRLDGHVKFEVAECDVTVHGNGKIVVVRPGDAAHGD